MECSDNASRVKNATKRAIISISTYVYYFPLTIIRWCRLARNNRRGKIPKWGLTIGK